MEPDHTVKGRKLDVKKAMSKTEMSSGGGGGGGRRGGRGGGGGGGWSRQDNNQDWGNSGGKGKYRSQFHFN